MSTQEELSLIGIGLHILRNVTDSNTSHIQILGSKNLYIKTTTLLSE